MTLFGAFEFPPVSHLFEWPAFLLEGTPFAINKTVLLMWVTVAMTGVIFLTVARNFRTVPGPLQNVVESTVGFVDDGIVGEVMGPGNRAWTPYLTSVFTFILFLNIFEVIPPISFPGTSRMAIPLVLAVLSWVLYVGVGFARQGPMYVINAIFPPGVPKPLYILITPIEFVSTFIIRPFALAVRLFANLFAGHLLLTAFFLLTASLWAANISLVALPLPLFMAIFLTGFEILVSFLQAYIFTILTAVFIADSMHAEH